MLYPLLSVTNAHFRRNFINADFSVVPDTLIDVLLNYLNTCYGSWAPRTFCIINNTSLPSYESFHPPSYVSVVPTSLLS